MVTWMNQIPALNLLDAARRGLDLPQEEWDVLVKMATPYQRRCARMIQDPTVAPHGRESTYIGWGCRCDPCTEAYSSVQAQRRAGKARRDFDSPAPGEQAHGTFAVAGKCRCEVCVNFLQETFGKPDEDVI